MPCSKPFKCTYPECSSAFAERGTLVNHERTHTGERPFKCNHPDCGAAFTQRGNLMVHMRTHTNARPFKCDFTNCKKAFNTRHDLIIHQRIHTGEKPYRCEYPNCGIAFTHRGNLKVHHRVHSGHRPFKCDYPHCNVAFTQNSVLVSHQRTHTGERPFICDFPNCGAAFAERGTLMNHRRTHTGEQPFKCSHPGCGAAFTQRGNLKFHLNSWHTPEGIARKKKEEERVANLLLAAGIAFKREHQVDFTCLTSGSFARIDFVLDLNGHIIMLEVDEDQHCGYDPSCEAARMAKITESLALEGNMLPITFLRYNPHTFSVAGVPTRIPKRQREARLLELIKSSRSPLYHGLPMSILYMYYDSTSDGQALVTMTSGHDATFVALSRLLT